MMGNGGGGVDVGGDWHDDGSWGGRADSSGGENDPHKNIF